MLLISPSRKNTNEYSFRVLIGASVWRREAVPENRCLAVDQERFPGCYGEWPVGQRPGCNFSECRTRSMMEVSRFGWNVSRMISQPDPNLPDVHSCVGNRFIAYLGHGVVHRVALLFRFKISFGWGLPMTTLIKKWCTPTGHVCRWCVRYIARRNVFLLGGFKKRFWYRF